MEGRVFVFLSRGVWKKGLAVPRICGKVAVNKRSKQSICSRAEIRYLSLWYLRSTEIVNSYSV